MNITLAMARRRLNFRTRMVQSTGNKKKQGKPRKHIECLCLTGSRMLREYSYLSVGSLEIMEMKYFH